MKHTGSRPPITGVAIECTDGGTLRHIAIDGLVVEGVYAPFFVKLGNRMDRQLSEDSADIPPGILEDVSIANITGTAVGTFAPSISGYAGHPVRRITVRDCQLSFAGGISAAEILHDIPEHSEFYPEIHMFIRKDPHERRLPAWACYLRDAEDVSFAQLQLFACAPLMHVWQFSANAV